MMASYTWKAGVGDTGWADGHQPRAGHTARASSAHSGQPINPGSHCTASAPLKHETQEPGALGAPGQPALPLHLLILTLHVCSWILHPLDGEGAGGQLPSLPLLQKEDRKEKKQEQQVGALGLWQTHPPVSELAPGLQHHSRQCQMDYTAWLKAEPGLCMTGGTELIQQ